MPKRPKVGGAIEVKAAATASYSRKRTTSEIIPPDVTRAKASAWLDIISPFREWAGLKGDALRFQREKLQMEREATLVEIARAYLEKRPSSTANENPIPNKFLIPYLEQASLEDSSSPLVDLWANLLVSAAEQFDSKFIHFVRIISSLSPKQADLFKKMFSAKTLHELEIYHDDVGGWFSSSAVRRGLQIDIEKKEPTTDDEFADFIVEYFARPVISMVHAAFSNNSTEAYYDVEFPYVYYTDEAEADFLILESLSLVRKVELVFIDLSAWQLAVSYYHLTALGLYFAKACKILPEN